ncbi:MAG: hydroxyacylglutathione hydrolase [Halothiobacillus sp. 13-55-253]|nr:MAG: hydroxyacylglutathione hydrolase [Halothiobacillus sp. 13-55-253]
MRIHAIPVLSDNYVWLIEGDQGQCAVVDPGEAAPVLAEIERRDLTLKAILLTHHHADHCQGVAGLRARFPVPVFGPALEAKTWVTHPLANLESFDLPQIGRFQAWHTPGHTLGHISLISDGAAFVGDTLFSAGCGRLFEGSPEQMLASLDRLSSLPGDTMIYCGHEYTADSLRFAHFAEPNNESIVQRIRAVNEARAAGLPSVPTSMSMEKQTNPFLRIRESFLRAAILKHAGSGSLSDADAFWALRCWKDEFDDLPLLPRYVQND